MREGDTIKKFVGIFFLLFTFFFLQRLKKRPYVLTYLTNNRVILKLVLSSTFSF
jgi:hypothetical protein